MKNLPPGAKLVFKGVIYEVWEWPQLLYNGATSQFQCLRRPNTAEVIATVGDKVIMLNQEQPHWKAPKLSIVGGRCDENESPLEAIRRELLEETGYTSNDIKLWREYEPSEKMVWVVYLFVARNCWKVSEQYLDPGEKIETIMVSFDEFLDIASRQEFYETELRADCVRAKYDPVFKEQFSKILFG